VETLQKERVTEIKTEFQRAQVQNDTEAVHKLTLEIKGSKSLNVPKQLATKITTHAKDKMRNKARQGMKGVAAELNRAYSEFDLESGQQHFKQ
jgi:Ni,Fe-hydrogenase III component G